MEEHLNLFKDSMAARIFNNYLKTLKCPECQANLQRIEEGFTKNIRKVQFNCVDCTFSINLLQYEK